MLVNEIMSKNPDALSDEKTIKEAALEMQKRDIGFIPVKHNGKIFGVLTDRDIIIRALAKGLDPAKTKLKDVITNNIYFCHETDDLKKAAKLMSDKQVNRLAVYDKDEQLTGIVSIGDIARKCKDTALCGELTKAIHYGQ
jgi:CBS domain-containing protein